MPRQRTLRLESWDERLDSVGGSAKKIPILDETRTVMLTTRGVWPNMYSYGLQLLSLQGWLVVKCGLTIFAEMEVWVEGAGGPSFQISSRAGLVGPRIICGGAAHRNGFTLQAMIDVPPVDPAVIPPSTTMHRQKVTAISMTHFPGNSMRPPALQHCSWSIMPQKSAMADSPRRPQWRGAQVYMLR